MITSNQYINRIFFSVACIWISTTLLTSCSAFKITDPASPFYIPSPGSVVIVHQRLEVPPGDTSVYLQFGKPVEKRKLDEYSVNCDFEIHTLADKPRYVEPGIYIVTRTIRKEDSIIQRHEKKPVQVAGIIMDARIGLKGGGDAPPMMFELVEMRLKADKPSDIKHLACRGAINDLVKMELPTLAEIRETLGKYASIQVPEEKAPTK